MAVKRVNEAGDVAERNAQTETEVLLKRTKAEADAVRTRAEAERLRLLAESEGAKAVIAARNSRTDAVMHLELEQYRLDKLPAIVEQMMKPAEKIDSIRIHQVTGFGVGTQGGSGQGGGTIDTSGKPPINQVMDSIMGMALQLPALKSIGESIGMDLSKAVPPGISPTPGPARPGGDA
jgi:flotillin